VHDRRGKRFGDVRGQPGSDLLDVRQLTRLVDLPELSESPHLALQIAAGPREGCELVTRHVGGVNLDQRVDEIETEPPPRLGTLEPRRKLARDHVPVEKPHHVERHAEHVHVFADGDDLRQSPEARRADRGLQTCLADHVVRGRWQRRTRRPAQHEPVAAALDEEGEVRAAAVADPRRGDAARPESVRIEERFDPLCDDQGRTGHRCDRRA
jgi:hypothetical protein